MRKKVMNYYEIFRVYDVIRNVENLFFGIGN